MLCKTCCEDKLSEEFPYTAVEDECEHPPLQCMRCTIAAYEDDRKKEKPTGKCPYPGCNITISSGGKEMIDFFKATIDQMFSEVVPHEEDTSALEGGARNKFFITLIYGDKVELSYDENTKISAVKKVLSEKIKHDSNKLKLVYKGKVLKIYEGGQMQTLKSYDVKAGSTVYLLVAQTPFPEDLKHVLFQFYWTYPNGSTCDFIDVTCFVYSNSGFVTEVDFDKDSYSNDAILHSGDIMDKINHIGSHRIDVHIDKLPANITQLYFVLSARNVANIHHFKNLEFKFFDSKNPFSALLNHTEIKRSTKKAIIVCCATRQEASWEIQDVNFECDGNRDKYGPIKNAIDNLRLR